MSSLTQFGTYGFLSSLIAAQMAIVDSKKSKNGNQKKAMKITSINKGK